MDFSTLVVGLTAFLVGIIAGFYLRGTMDRGRAPRAVHHTNAGPEGRSAADAKAFLIVTEGSDLGKKYPLTDSGLKVGRSLDNDLVLDDSAVSRFHADIKCENGVFYACDLGSTNGTLVNGEPVSIRALKDGDVMQIGTTVLRFCRNP